MVRQRFLDNFKIFCVVIFAICITLIMFCASKNALAGGKIYQPSGNNNIYGTPRAYSRDQQIRRGTREQKKYTTCRLAKMIKSQSTGKQACIYRGGNRTFELMFEDSCPKQYQCVYNPGQPEPNIDSVVESLNQIGK